MINWLRKILGIDKLWLELRQTQLTVYRIEKKVRVGRRPQRYDEIERARKRRHKRKIA